MVANYQQDAINEFRNYLWNRLISKEVARNIEQPEEGSFNDLTGGSINRVFEESSYYDPDTGDQYVPIIPVQQSQLFIEKFGSNKHIVYDKIGISYNSNWMICEEQILFTIYSPNYSDVVEIVNFMVDEFRRMDESARDLNRSGLIIGPFKFHSISVIDLTPTSPSDELAGPLAADLVLDIKYSRFTDNEGRFI